MKATLSLLGWFLHFETGLESEIESDSEDDEDDEDDDDADDADEDEYDSEETGVAEVSELTGQVEHADVAAPQSFIGFRRMQ